MPLVTFEQWKSWSKTYSMLPYVEKVELDPDFAVLSWEQAWKASADNAFVLESGKSGRYSFLGLHPFSILQGKGNEARIDSSGEPSRLAEGKPLKVVKEWMSAFGSPKIEGLPKFIGGIVGYWGYDVGRSIERLPVMAKDDLSCPEYAFMMMDQVWILDQARRELWCAVHERIDPGLPRSELLSRYEQARQKAERMKLVWKALFTDDGENRMARRRIARLLDDIAGNRIQIDVDSINGVFTDFTREQYMAAVLRIQEYIRQGDVFQVNLSVRQSRKLDSPPERIYEWLRHLNPSPYMGFLKFADFQLVSGSPELLVQLEGDRVRARPIAGTRPRGESREEDERYRREMLENEKERAEHIMLVDLCRNDLGRISKYGTVRVDDLMSVEAYSHVMHIVSGVTGELMPDKDAFDVLAATFPGGTITGAPKIRTMEIIEELEPVRRGPYTGSIGWIDYNGNMEFNIVIRTLLAEGGIGHVQAGAGIVIDSDPAREYTESLNKAKALWKAVQYASMDALHPAAKE